ncbi:alpha/beta hydrolase [Paraburkholderia terrae]|uniref:alpha/beta fold hydrolase n=1 Tax=Paraburkholderia TaxID=1822464 RepID=UPI001EE299C5|nr:alpha/beta hydrolase [Paraburkholderia terrae]BEU21184.1 alpha/beta hydrolase [Paraburkholderia sp. 22B1P]GJH07155.1 alpha/beta fold hydrolase [Paraburkholderia terrae]GJH39446.1 alpha/beta fold hydrolase [Paraburkholderia hospita]
MTAPQVVTHAPPAAFAGGLEAYPAIVSMCSHGRFGYREGSMTTSEGLPVVLLHGIGSGSASWVQQLAALSRTRRAIAWDTPGYGETTPVSAQFPVAVDYSAVLASSLRALAIERCVLVGHSLGAIIAAAYARENPVSVAGLLLISPANGYAAADPEVRARKRDARLSMLDTLGPRGMAAQRSGNMLSAHASENARAWVRWNMGRVIPSGYRQATHLLANANLCGDLAVFQGRAQVMVGEDDEITPPAACKRVADAAQSILKIIPRAGHAGYVEQPEAYTSSIEQFCRRCDEAGER